MLFEIARTTIFDVPVLRVVGELDLTTAPALAKAVDAELVVRCLDQKRGGGEIQLADGPEDGDVEGRGPLDLEQHACSLVPPLMHLAG